MVVSISDFLDTFDREQKHHHSIEVYMIFIIHSHIIYLVTYTLIMKN